MSSPHIHRRTPSKNTRDERRGHRGLVRKGVRGQARQPLRSSREGWIADGWIKRRRADEIIARYHGTIGGDVPAIHGGEQALAAKIARLILWLPCSSDQLLPAFAIAAFAEHLPASRVAVCRLDCGHRFTSVPAGSPEFKFHESHTANFFRKGS